MEKIARGRGRETMPECCFFSPYCTSNGGGLTGLLY